MRGSDWIDFLVAPETDLNVPGIYHWQIGDLSYVGKAARLRGRLNEYLNNVRKIEAGLPYRRGKPNGFRAVHRQLALAKSHQSPISWNILEFCASRDMLLQREQYWIGHLSPALNGPQGRPQGAFHD